MTSDDLVVTSLEHERTRYQSKGFGLLLAVLLAVGIFHYTPEVLRAIWPQVLHYTLDQGWEKWQVVLFGSYIWHLLLTIVMHSIMYLIYHFELPCFERYKITSDPWPWYQNREEWRKLL
jgi:hypothetical protein